MMIVLRVLFCEYCADGSKVCNRRQWLRDLMRDHSDHLTHTEEPRHVNQL